MNIMISKLKCVYKPSGEMFCKKNKINQIILSNPKHNNIKYYKTKFNKINRSNLDEMENIWKYCFDTTFDWYYYSNILLAKDNNIVVGFVGYLNAEQLKLWLKTNKLNSEDELENYGYNKDGLYIYNLGVDISYRKKKIGTKLIKFLIKMNINNLYLWVDILNQPAVDLYLNLGFKIEKELNVYNKKIYILRYIINNE
jgi:ribosomal protein S18 acetylase RimI-like enzyme